MRNRVLNDVKSVRGVELGVGEFEEIGNLSLYLHNIFEYSPNLHLIKCELTSILIATGKR